MNFFKKVLQNFKSKKQESERIYILDTCALKTRKSIEIIEEASKIILLTGTIRELDRYKKEKSLYGSNICIISKKSREDEKSEKYICVAGYEKYNYQDDNIIDYCRKHRDVTILTSDNNLCNMAKAYNISYIFLEEDEQEEKKLQNSQDKQNGLQNVKGVAYKDKGLYLKNGVKGIIYLVIRKQEVLKNISGLKLQVGDIIYRIKYIDSRILLNKYKIVVIEKSNYAKHFFHIEFNCSSMEKIKEKNFPTEVKNAMISLLKEELEPKQEEKLEVKEASEQEK